MPNQIKKSAQELLENAQVILESLEGTLFRLYVSYDQCDLSDDKTRAMMSVCIMLANGALEDIESASAKTKLNISMFIRQSHGIVIMLDELFQNVEKSLKNEVKIPSVVKNIYAEYAGKTAETIPGAIKECKTDSKQIGCTK
ncbi:hypothetical protein PX668_13770 [Acinetobacter soli]|nr:hypothetical protein [Acinetobacter soli]WEI13476.1 hypothetical protein PX667_05105 [Acinetobacter soli]WEI15154.1 hypothetical protein PX668_13770 [Acinetobacter soli]